jgi:hypothetical protein
LCKEINLRLDRLYALRIPLDSLIHVLKMDLKFAINIYSIKTHFFVLFGSRELKEGLDFDL